MLRRPLICFIAFFHVAVASLHSQTFTTLYNFDSATSGDTPQGNLALSSNTFFGVTLEGGTNGGGGVVYSMNTDGSDYTVLRAFSYNSATNGWGPSAGLVLSGDMLYGTCSGGGASNYGTIFGMQTDGSNYFILHGFTGGVDMGDPMGGMALISNTLYGTTYNGTIFSLNTNGSAFTNLHVFTGPDGLFPGGILTVSGGRLYGTTAAGGSNENGTVFSLNTDGSGFTNLHDFVAATDGSDPSGGVLVSGDTLYGVAAYGGAYSNGSVFSMTTNGAGFRPLHFFHNSSSDGSTPYGYLTLFGSFLYGTAINGGSNNQGVAFSLNVNGSGYTNLCAFNDAGGSYPAAGLLLTNDILYGTTTEGGSNGWGVIFALPLDTNAAPPLGQLQIFSQPVGQTGLSFGTNVSFSVGAQSIFSSTLQYQWRLNGVNIPDATNSVFVIPDVEVTNCGVYTVVVSDGNSSVTSLNAPLTPNLPFLSGNDNLTNAAILPSTFTGIISSENTNATADPGEIPILPGNPPSNSIWFKWTAPATGIATFTTEGSGFDTVLGAFNGSLSNRAGLADDDSGGYLTSLITFNAAQGQVFLIGVDGHDGASGHVVLSWNDVPGPFGATIITPPTPKTVVSNSASVVFSCQADGGNALWFKVGDSSPVGGGTDFGISSVNSNTVGTYYAVVQGSEAGTVRTEPFQLQINLLEDGTSDSNSLAYNKFLDAAANPFDQPPPQGQHVRTAGGDTRGYTLNQVFSTTGYTSEPGEPSICGQIGGAPAWYAYAAPTNGSLLITTAGSSFNTMLGVFESPSAILDFAALTSDGCGYTTSAAQGQPQVYVTGVVKKHIYYIVVDGYQGASGAVNLNVNCGQSVSAITPPQNQYVALGQSASFSIIAQGSVPLSFQWQCNGTNIPLATNASLTLPSVSSGQLGLYTVLVANLVSQSSYSASLAQSAGPVIITQPQSGSVHSGATATLTVAASGAPAPDYYWKFNGASAGGNSPMLVIPNFQAANEGTYSVLASNYLGVAPASNALLFLDSLRFLPPTLAAGDFQIQLVGVAGSNYVIQTSIDLSNWIPLWSNNAGGGILDFSDTNAGAHPIRFYRAATN